MTRKAKPFVLIAAAVYIFILWSAFRWGSSQRYPEGSIFAHRAAEARKWLAEEAARQPAPERPKSTAVTRFEAAATAYVAARYDDTHVVFLVVPHAEPRFPESQHRFSLGTLIKLNPPAKPSADLMGLQELWEPDSQSRARLPQSVQSTPIGEQWSMDLTPGSNVPVFIESPVVAATGCFLSAGFLASPTTTEKTFARSSAEYFVIRHTPIESADPPVSVQVSELRNWRATADFQNYVASLLVGLMKQEVSKLDTQLVKNADNPSQVERPWPATSSLMRVNHWLAVDRKLQQDKGTLDYDLHAFRITPDGVPRVLVRARWMLAGTPVFLMTAWFRADAQPVLLFADSNWSTKMRDGEAGDSLGQRLDFQTVLNEFDADHDGWAELLVHSHDGDSADITLYLYTDLGLVPTKTSFERDLTAPQSCLHQD